MPWARVDNFGHGQPERPGEFAREHFRDKRPATLACAPELDHIQPIVVGLDDGGQRASFAERRDVACNADGSHERRQVVTRADDGREECSSLAVNDFAGSALMRHAGADVEARLLMSVNPWWVFRLHPARCRPRSHPASTRGRQGTVDRRWQ